MVRIDAISITAACFLGVASASALNCPPNARIFNASSDSHRAVLRLPQGFNGVVSPDSEQPDTPPPVLTGDVEPSRIVLEVLPRPHEERGMPVRKRQTQPTLESTPSLASSTTSFSGTSSTTQLEARGRLQTRDASQATATAEPRVRIRRAGTDASPRAPRTNGAVASLPGPGTVDLLGTGGNQSANASSSAAEAASLGDLPKRVDVRCRYQWINYKKQNHLFYRIFLGNNNNAFPDFCDDVEDYIKTTCRDEDDNLLDGDGDVRWNRCDYDSRDILGFDGLVATFELHEWDGGKTDNGNPKCVADGIRNATEGHIIDWIQSEGCMYLQDRRYFLNDG